MIPISEAISIIKRETFALEAEIVALSIACGCILAEDIFADSDLPPFDRSQMDGYAVKSEDLQNVPVRLKIVGESKAGAGWHFDLKPGEAVRIMTGAPVPSGADAVQKIEVTKEAGEFVEIFESTKIGQFINPKASEIIEGEQVFSKGELITDKMVASLASFGYAQVKVSKRPKVSVLATGSELVAISEKPKEDEIRDSNSIMLQIFANQFAEVETLSMVHDDLESLKSKIKSQKSEILILTGGVSIGMYDFTKLALIELGAEIFFDKVCLKPGKPCVFAKLNDTLIFGLPGNPVSVAVTFYLFARMAILLMQKASQAELKQGFAVLSKQLKGAKERDSYLPAILSTDQKGQLIATPLRFFGSSDFVSFSRCEALIFIPQNTLSNAQSIVKIVFI